jgi:Phage tail sheath protein.
LSANRSTSTATDFERDFFTRRIIDQAILIVKQVGEAIIGRVNDETTRDLAAEEAQGALEQLVNDGLLEGNTGDETNLAVTATEVDPTTVGLNARITPVGVAKSVDATIEVDTS